MTPVKSHTFTTSHYPARMNNIQKKQAEHRTAIVNLWKQEEQEETKWTATRHWIVTHPSEIQQMTLRHAHRMDVVKYDCYDATKKYKNNGGNAAIIYPDPNHLHTRHSLFDEKEGKYNFLTPEMKTVVIDHICDIVYYYHHDTVGLATSEYDYGYVGRFFFYLLRAADVLGEDIVLNVLMSRCEKYLIQHSQPKTGSAFANFSAFITLFHSRRFWINHALKTCILSATPADTVLSYCPPVLDSARSMWVTALGARGTRRHDLQWGVDAWMRM